MIAQGKMGTKMNGNGATSQYERRELGAQVFDESFIKYSLASEDYLDQLLPALKSSLMTDTLDSFVEKLDSASKEKEEELEGLSFSSLDDLTNTVSNINKVTKSSHSLAVDLVQLNNDLNKSGSEVATLKKKGLEYSMLSSKINKTIFTLNSCLSMLDKTNNVLNLIQSDEFYKALMNLELLTKTHVEEIENFEFTKKVYASIPTLKQRIRDESLNRLHRWLSVSVEKNLLVIGESLFENMRQLNDEWTKKVDSDQTLITFRVNSPVEKALRPQQLSTFNPLHSKDINVDMGPLYQTVLVFQAFKEEHALKDNFAKELLRKRDRLTSNMNGTQSTKEVFRGNESLKLFIQELVAFFVCDVEISREVGPNLRTKQNTTDLYNSITSKLIPILKSHIDQNADSFRSLNDLNDILGTYVQILEDYGFNIESIYEVMIHLFDKYIEFAVWEFSETYKEISAKDGARPVIVEDADMHDTYISKCFYIPAEDHESVTKFPQTYPFSAIYPATCLQLRGLMVNLCSFIVTYYGHRSNKLCLMIGEAIDNVLADVVLKDLSKKIESSFKEELSQNLINLEFFSNSVIEIEKHLNYSSDQMLKSVRSSSFLIKLHAAVKFKNTRTQAEDRMFSLLDTKVNGLMEMAEWEWDTNRRSEDATIFIKDIGELLESMFSSTFNYLPYSFKSLLLIRTFDLLAVHFKNALYAARLITDSAVHNFRINILYMETLIQKLNRLNEQQHDYETTKRSSMTLQNMFGGLKQYVELLETGSLDQYNDDATRRFNTISYEDAVQLIGKLESYQKKLAAQYLTDDLHSVNGNLSRSDSLKSITRSPSTRGKFFSRFTKTS